MTNLTLVCRNATTFTKTGEIDEDAYRQSLQSFIENGIGTLAASGGTGEGNGLTNEELKILYKAAVAEGKGKILVGVNNPESFNARGSIERAQVAVEAGVDLINIYGPSGMHGYRPTDAEYIAYFDNIFAEIKHPVALSPNRLMGYAPKESVMAELCNKYSQVTHVILGGTVGDDFFTKLREYLTRDVALIVGPEGSFNTLALGAAGLIARGSTFIPKTVKSYADLYSANKLDEASLVYADLKRVTQFTSKWGSTSPRCHKMIMKIFKLPGWEGGLREPYLPFDEAEEKKFTEGVLKLGVPEIDELARNAGLI